MTNTAIHTSGGAGNTNKFWESGRSGDKIRELSSGEAIKLVHTLYFWGRTAIYFGLVVTRVLHTDFTHYLGFMSYFFVLFIIFFIV